MANVGTTAVLALVPAAEELLAAAAVVNPMVVRPGVPAHATLLYPFLPESHVDSNVMATLRRGLAGRGRVRLSLEFVQMESSFVGVAVPELDPLASTVRSLWPQVRPYGGQFGDDPPVHVTIAMSASANEVERIGCATTALLPLVDEISEISVVGLGERGWRRLATVPLD